MVGKVKEMTMFVYDNLCGVLLYWSLVCVGVLPCTRSIRSDISLWRLWQIKSQDFGFSV